MNQPAPEKAAQPEACPRCGSAKDQQEDEMFNFIKTLPAEIQALLATFLLFCLPLGLIGLWLQKRERKRRARR